MSETCRLCNKTPAVAVALTIPIPPDTLNPNAPRERVGTTYLCAACVTTLNQRSYNQ